MKGINFDYENKQSCNKFLTAVLQGSEKTVRKLLRNNWNPNSTDNQGRTAVHLAARSASHYNILKLLLDSGGLPDHVTHSGATALCLAAFAGLEKNVSLLLERGASVSIKNYIEATPLHFSCNGPSVNVVRLLKEAGAKINEVDFYKVTPLMLAVKNKQHSIVRYLLDNGADISLKDCDEKTVFHYACSNNDLEVFNLLLKRHPHSAAVSDIVDSEGWTLLMFAAQSGSKQITDALLELGSDTSKRNHNGLMALHLAAHNSAECFASLLERTPVDVINSFCVYSPEPLNNSLPCLLIDKLYLDSLKQLFNKPGIDAGVLTCPTAMGNLVVHPVAFTFYSNSPTDFASAFVQMYIEKGLPLDPEFPDSSIVVFTCLRTLLRAHVEDNNLEHESCTCAEIFSTLLEHGADPDLLLLPKAANYGEWFFWLLGSTFVLAHFLRYSNLLEPHHILKIFTKQIQEMDINNSFLPFTKTTRSIEFLCQYCRPWDITKCKALLSSGKNNNDDIEAFLVAYHRSNSPFPSLQFLCRATLRDYQHASVTSSLPVDDFPLDYDLNVSKEFRTSLNHLPLPKYLLSYIQYDDIISGLKSNLDYPSFDMVEY